MFASLPAVDLLGHSAVDWGLVAVFSVVYLGMFLGGLPSLKLDRSGVALLGAIAVMPIAGLSVEQAAQAVDLPTIVLLFAFMVVSAQMRLGGFYTTLTQRVAALPLSRAGLLAALIVVAGALSAVFSNDVVCLAMTPVAISLLLLWLAYGPAARAGTIEPVTQPPVEDDPEPAFDALQTAKGLTVAACLMVVFLFTDWPRDVAALVGAAVLLLSRRLHSAHVMGFVDWPLLLMFIGLFVVNHAFETTGLAAQAVAWLGAQGVQVGAPGPLLVLGVALSNLVSNVPAVMLLLPHLRGQEAGATLALVSTFAGNLLLVGSIANLIVVDLAHRAGGWPSVGASTPPRVCR